MTEGYKIIVLSFAEASSLKPFGDHRNVYYNYISVSFGLKNVGFENDSHFSSEN